MNGRQQILSQIAVQFFKDGIVRNADFQHSGAQFSDVSLSRNTFVDVSLPQILQHLLARPFRDPALPNQAIQNTAEASGLAEGGFQVTDF